jgi:ABC-2 type transport system ATP-binding protein
MSLLSTSNLSKDYGNGKGAFEISIAIEAGEIVGFIGPNGAGKSTTINMCSGLIRPTEGSFQLFDQDVTYQNIHKFYPQIGLLLSEVNFDKNLTPQDIFQENQTLLGINCTARWKELATLFQVDLKKSFGSLSFGNRKKIGIINAIMHNPKLIILDEPTSGLDPLVQQHFMNVLKDLAKSGSAILLSSHVLSEVQAFCQRIIMIKSGKIILEDTTQSILNKAARLFRIKNIEESLLSQIQAVAAITKIQQEVDETLLYTTEFEKVLKFLIEQDFYDFFLERPSLEEMFLELY